MESDSKESIHDPFDYQYFNNNNNAQLTSNEMHSKVT